MVDRGWHAGPYCFGAHKPARRAQSGQSVGRQRGFSAWRLPINRRQRGWGFCSEVCVRSLVARAQARGRGFSSPTPVGEGRPRKPQAGGNLLLKIPDRPAAIHAGQVTTTSIDRLPAFLSLFSSLRAAGLWASFRRCFTVYFSSFSSNIWRTDP
jgi:hypothetical protein